MELSSSFPYQITPLHLAEWECKWGKLSIIKVEMDYHNWEENFIEENEKKINNHEDKK